MFHPYFGAFALFGFCAVAFCATLWAQRALAKRLNALHTNIKRDTLKLAPYECGPLPYAQPNAISTHYFLMALLFILFDIEVLFFYPWALDFRLFGELGLGGFALFEMASFALLLALGFIYAWKRGALTWQKM